MIIAYTDQNELDWGIKLLDDSKADLTKELIQEGMDAWYGAAHDSIEATEHFTTDDVASFYGSGYSEPACELLDRFKIPYESIKLEYNEDDEIVADVIL